MKKRLAITQFYVMEPMPLMKPLNTGSHPMDGPRKYPPKQPMKNNPMHGILDD